jgi:UDP-glucose 4-epimerase
MRHSITGGAGFIGSHLADALVARGDSVVILDDFCTGSHRNIEHLSNSTSVSIVDGSILDGKLVDDLMGAVDTCLHLASAVGVELIVSKPLESLQTNVRGCDIVISAAAHHDRRLLFTSTSEVYGKQNSAVLHEDSDRVLGSTFKSRWVYAIAKSYAESLVYALCRQNDVQGTVMRLFNTVGPRQTGAYGMVLPRLVRQAMTGSDLTVYGDGSQTRCFIHIVDTVRAITMLLDEKLSIGRVFNIGNDAEISILDLAVRVIERTESDSRIMLVPYEQAYGAGFEELGRRKPDASALKQLTGWNVSRTLDDAIDDVIAYETRRELALSAGAPASDLTVAAAELG